MKRLGHSRTSLGTIWDVTRETVGRLCQAAEVPKYYEDALKFLLLEKQLQEMGFDLSKAFKVKPVAPVKTR